MIIKFVQIPQYGIIFTYKDLAWKVKYKVFILSNNWESLDVIEPESLSNTNISTKGTLSAVSSCLHTPRAQRGVSVQEERGLWVGALWGVCQPPGGEVKWISSLIHFSWLFSFQISSLCTYACRVDSLLSLSIFWASLWACVCLLLLAEDLRRVKVETCWFPSSSSDQLTTPTLICWCLWGFNWVRQLAVSSDGQNKWKQYRFECSLQFVWINVK